MKLPLAIESDWNRYNALKESGLKKQANKVLLQVVKNIEEHKYYSQLYKDSEEWLSGNHDYDFVQWCENNKRKYGWVQTYYYE